MDQIPMRWCAGLANWGDILSPYLTSLISGKKAVLCTDISKPKYSVIGSQMNLVDRNTIVWGSGFMLPADNFQKGPPKQVLAVRGPMTRQRLLQLKVPCPEVYGDPALLYPRYYHPKVEKKYVWGIIPHYVDVKHPWLKRFVGNPKVKVIDITQSINGFVDDVLSCERIVSSALHGIIAGDAYGLPSYWIELSNKVFGQGFKFRDYFASVSRPSVRLTPDMGRLKDMSVHMKEYKVNIDLNKLMDACPFKSKDI